MKFFSFPWFNQVVVVSPLVGWKDTGMRVFLDFCKKEVRIIKPVCQWRDVKLVHRMRSISQIKYFNFRRILNHSERYIKGKGIPYITEIHGGNLFVHSQILYDQIRILLLNEQKIFGHRTFKKICLQNKTILIRIYSFQMG